MHFRPSAEVKFGILLFAEPLHAQEELYKTLQQRENPKKHNMASLKWLIVCILLTTSPQKSTLNEVKLATMVHTNISTQSNLKQTRNKKKKA